ncbi:uncharacterized protein VTP21DRAFT_11305 [Calcarisporiella thermophila]|uniref:uncharacterized protein n=1 Tax=Calcarisporiella thermophila TaxID=911321 RepID=UPI00374310F5
MLRKSLQSFGILCCRNSRKAPRLLYIRCQPFSSNGHDANENSLSNSKWKRPVENKFIIDPKDVARATGKKQTSTRFVMLHRLPFTTIRDDVERLWRDCEIRDSDVLDVVFSRNQYFQPTGMAIIEFTEEPLAARFLLNCQKKFLGGVQISSSIIADPAKILSQHSRPELGAASGRAVVLRGLPGRLGEDEVREWVDRVGFTPMESTEPGVIKLQNPAKALTSKFLIKLGSESDAYRMVRKVHNTRFMSRVYGSDYTIRASVVY